MARSQGIRVLSRPPLGRAREAASSRGVSDRIEFVALDLSDGFPDGEFDLISAQFLHSTVRLDRTTILARAARAIRPGGLLVIVDHGSGPPWASKLDHHHVREFDKMVDSLPLNEWHHSILGVNAFHTAEMLSRVFDDVVERFEMEHPAPESAS